MEYKMFNMSKLTLKNIFFSMQNALWMNVQGVHILLYTVRNMLLCNKYIDYIIPLYTLYIILCTLSFIIYTYHIIRTTKYDLLISIQHQYIFSYPLP